MLDGEELRRLDRIVNTRVERTRETVRLATHGRTGERTPPGFIRLRTPGERAVWTDYLKRQALAEQEGRAPGDTAVSMLDNPIMQQAGQPNA